MSFPPPHPQWRVPGAVFTLVIRNSEPCGSTNPSIKDAALSPSLLQWQITPAQSFWCFISILSPVLHTLILRKMPLAVKSWVCVLGPLVSVGRQWRMSHLLSCWAIAWVHQRPDMCGHNFCLPQPLRQCVWMCVWIFMYVPCTHECMTWRKLLQGRGS